jgi:hypothetical protein
MWSEEQHVTQRLEPPKTGKLVSGGALPRSHSRHSCVGREGEGPFLAHAVLGSRNDARNAVALDEPEFRRELEVAAADNVKRVRRPDTDDWCAEPALTRIRSFLETQTVRDPISV